MFTAGKRASNQARLHPRAEEAGSYFTLFFVGCFFYFYFYFYQLGGGVGSRHGLWFLMVRALWNFD